MTEEEWEEHLNFLDNAEISPYPITVGGSHTRGYGTVVRDLQLDRMCAYLDTPKLAENSIPASEDCTYCESKAGEIHARTCPYGERYKQAKEIRDAARDLGRLGGLAKSEAKTQSSRENGKKGGRPRKVRKGGNIETIEESNLDLFM